MTLVRRLLPIAAILSVAAVVRVWGIDFGLPHTLCRPDEETIHAVACRFFTRDLNPHFLTYPTLFIYAVFVLYVIYFKVGKLFGFFTAEWKFIWYATHTLAPFFLIDRLASAACGVATVAVVYAIGRRLFDRTTGLMAAAFLALALLHVRDSHFGVTDVPATFLALVSFLYIVRFAQGGALKDMLLSAVCAGLAASTKYNAAVIAMPAVLAVAGLRLASPDSAPARAVRARQAVGFAAVMGLAFLLGTPYALLDWRQFTTDVLAQSDRLASAHGVLLGRGWIVHLTTSLRYGLGLPLLAAAIAGFAWMVRADRRTALILGIFPVAYFVAMGWGLTVFARYMLPIVPFLCLAGAWAVTRATRAMVPAAAPPAARTLALFISAALVIAPSAWNVVQLDRLLATEDSRLVALTWLKNHAIDEASVFQSAKIYSRVQFGVPSGIQRKGEWGFDEACGCFTVDGAPSTGQPDIVIVQTSALELYTKIPRGLSTVLARDYEPAWRVTAQDPAAKSNVYDVQDAFFLPLAGFAGIERPGPNIDIYRRRPQTR